MTNVSTQVSPPDEHRWESYFGCALAFVAAVLAVNDLGSGKYGDDQLQGANDKTSAYMWYQSKGIKESLVEGQRDLLKSLLTAGTIQAAHVESLTQYTTELDKKIGKYKKEKNEIMLGSAAVGKENWAQDVEGELGKVIGAKEIESRVSKLDDAGDKFDGATLFLQLSLVIGAIGILLKKDKLKSLFFTTMCVLGVVGAVFCVIAYRIAMS